MGRTQQLGNYVNGIFQDASNNIGIGGSPSGSYKFEVTGTGRFTSNVILNNLGIGGQTIRSSSALKVIESNNWVIEDNGDFGFKSNAYFNGTNNVYINTGLATRLYAGNGAFEFYTAPSGTAGATTTFTSRFFIGNTGNVGIGTTNPLSKLSVGGDGYASRAITAIASGTDFGMTLQQNSTGGGLQIYANVASWGNIPMQIQTNSGYQFIITTAGLVGIGTGSPVRNLSVSTSGETYVSVTGGASSDVGYLFGTSASDAKGRLIYNNADNMQFWVNSTERMRIRADGIILSLPTYNNTTGNAANMQIGTAGEFQRSTASSQRFKENIIDWDGSGLDTILSLKPKTFTYKENYYSCPDRQFLGLIAEEVAEVSSFLADFENEDGTGQVENVRYANIVVPLIKAVQELSAKISALEAKA